MGKIHKPEKGQDFSACPLRTCFVNLYILRKSDIYWGSQRSEWMKISCMEADWHGQVLITLAGMSSWKDRNHPFCIALQQAGAHNWMDPGPWGLPALFKMRPPTLFQSCAHHPCWLQGRNWGFHSPLFEDPLLLKWSSRKVTLNLQGETGRRQMATTEMHGMHPI